MSTDRENTYQSDSDKAEPRQNQTADPTPDYLLPDGKIDWNVALRENERWMRSTIALRVGEQGAVDEVFQEVALAAASQKAPLRDVAKVGSWLYRLVVVQSALYRRKAGRKRKLLKRYETEIAPTQGENRQMEPLDWLLSRERQELVRNALNTLSEDERQMLLMKYRDDLSYHEIAEKLRTTDLAVQSKLHRARAKLKRSIIVISNGAING